MVNEEGERGLGQQVGAGQPYRIQGKEAHLGCAVRLEARRALGARSDRRKRPPWDPRIPRLRSGIQNGPIFPWGVARPALFPPIRSDSPPSPSPRYRERRWRSKPGTPRESRDSSRLRASVVFRGGAFEDAIQCMEQLVGEEDSPFRPRDHAQVEEDGAVAAVEAAGELRGIV